MLLEIKNQIKELKESILKRIVQRACIFVINEYVAPDITAKEILNKDNLLNPDMNKYPVSEFNQEDLIAHSCDLGVYKTLNELLKVIYSLIYVHLQNLNF